MIIEVFLGGPVLVFSRCEDGTVAEGQDVPGEVLLGLDSFGHQNLILGPDTHQGFRDPTLSNEVRYRKEKEGLVRCEMVHDLRVPIPPSVGPQCREHLEVFIKHLSEQASPKLVSL